MKKSRFTDSQIMAALKSVEVGLPVPEICRELGISTATFYKWRAKFGGMDTCPALKKFRTLPRSGCGPTVTTARIWLWAVSSQSSIWPGLHNCSTFRFCGNWRDYPRVVFPHSTIFFFRRRTTNMSSKVQASRKEVVNAQVKGIGQWRCITHIAVDKLTCALLRDLQQARWLAQTG